MMRKLLYILWKEWLQLVRSPSLVTILILCPVVIIGIVPFGLGNRMEIQVDVVDLSQSVRGRETVAELARSAYISDVSLSRSLQESEQRMDRGEVQGIVVIPADGGTPVVLVDGSHFLLARETEFTILEQLRRSPPVPAGIQAYLEQYALRPHHLFVSGEGSRHYYLVTMLVLLMSIVGCCLSTISVVSDIERNKWEHLRSTGMSATLYLFSKVLFFTLCALVEVGVGLLFSRLLYGFSIAGSLVDYFLLATCFLVAVIPVGILISAVCGSQIRAIYVFVFVFIVLTLLSTMFAPLDNMSPAWASTRFFNPFFWMVDASWKILLKGFSLVDILPACLVLLTIGTIVSLLGIRRLRRIG